VVDRRTINVLRAVYKVINMRLCNQKFSVKRKLNQTLPWVRLKKRLAKVVWTNTTNLQSKWFISSFKLRLIVLIESKDIVLVLLSS
jgi:hypothetical protein